MANDIEFADGIYYKDPHPKAPDFIRGTISIQREKFIGWLQQKEGDYVNLDIKESQKGNLYIAVNDFKPTKAEKPQVEDDPAGRQYAKEAAQQAPADFPDDDIPFD